MSRRCSTLGPWSERTQPLAMAVSQQQLLCSNNCQLECSIIKHKTGRRHGHSATQDDRNRKTYNLFGWFSRVLLLLWSFIIHHVLECEEQRARSCWTNQVPKCCRSRAEYKIRKKQSWLGTMNRIVFDATSVSNPPALCVPHLMILLFVQYFCFYL